MRFAALPARAKRLEDLAVQMMTAIGERDAVVAAAQHRARNALREMTTGEGVKLHDPVEWCGYGKRRRPPGASVRSRWPRQGGADMSSSS